MMKRQYIKAGVGLRLLAVVALVLTIVPTQARAIVLAPVGAQNIPGGTLTVNCVGGPSLSYTIDSTNVDIFIRYVNPKLITSAIQTSVSTVLSTATASGGLAVIPHIIPASCNIPYRCLAGSGPTCPQWIDVTESTLTPPDQKWGQCFQGIAQDNCTIFTTWIQSFMSSCNAAAQTTAAITWTTIHEIGHASGCVQASAYNASLGGYHVDPSLDTMMSQSVVCNCKKGSCTIPTDFKLSVCPPQIQPQ